ncbi:nucleolar pre-ribosomal-associated protein 1 isoform X2 [Narcine bancroftii]|uniref:nucleolar pre-ribosomal-associated protein 1 isoform X2 n=1 Tax=Narcine bancroftii TaxID=1343680 RepID=UPI00383196E4
MAEKRKCGGVSNDTTASKVARSAAAEFTGARFKSQLKSSESVEQGLATFVSIAKQLPCSDLHDVVEGYIKISVECADIFKLLDGEKRPENEMILIFQALEAILLRTASDLSHYSAVGMNIVTKLLHSYVKLINSALYSASLRFCRICLGLLSAMVSQGPEAAQDFFSHFDFNNNLLPGLLKKRDRTGRPDVRMAYIKFVVSFLITGDNTTISHVLELKDFIADVCTSELKEDHVSVINLLISTLKTKVVQNKGISKTQKVRLFSPRVLNHIATLYRWSGIVDVHVNTEKEGQDPLVAGKNLVRELVHSFLIDLCCSLKHGINFYDSSLGTAKRGGNVVLLRFLLSLKTATEDELVADLMVNIFKVCPDLLNRFFKETQYSFVPRVKTVWLDNMKLLRKIYDAQPEISKAFRTKEYIPLSRLVSMVMVTTVPPVATKAMFIQGINIANKVVRQTTFSLLMFVLERALKNIEYCLNEDVWQHSEIYTHSTMEDFTQQFRETLSKYLPDMNSIVATWQSLLQNEDKDGRQGETGVAVTENSNVAEDDGIVSEKGVKEEVAPVLQHCILQLALELPSNKFAWFRFQDITITEKNSGENSVFYLLLKMYVTCKSSQLQKSTKQLIIKILKDTGIFEYTWNELELWMKGLYSVLESERETVILFLELVLIKLISNPYPYTDKISDAIQEASVLQANLDGQDADAVSLPVSNIDDVMDMVDVIMETSEGLNDEVGFTLSDEVIAQTFPFSAVVTAALEVRNKMILGSMNRTDAPLQYLFGILTNILHVQKDPLALCLILQMYDKELDSFTENQTLLKNIFQFYTYYSLWIPRQAKETMFEQFGTERKHSVPLKETSFCTLLMEAYEMDILLSEEIKDHLKQAVAQLHLHELVLSVKQVMLYIRTSVTNFSELGRNIGLGLIEVCMDLLKSLLQKCELSEDVIEEKLEIQGENEHFVHLTPVEDELTKEKVLESMLSAIFKHTILEQWFMAMELQAPPAHNLNPISFKMLSTRLSSGTLSLLELSVPSLQRLGRMDIALTYFKAIVESVLKELEMKKSFVTKLAAKGKKSLPLKALESLNKYMDISWLKEIVESMLELPEEHLAIKTKSERGGFGETQLSLYGNMLVKILTENHQESPGRDDLLLSCDHFSAVGTLFQYSNSEEVEVLLSVLVQNPVFAQAVRPNVLLDCLNHMTKDSLSICTFLIQHSKTNLLQFELWCLESGKKKHLQKNMDAYLSLLNTYLECREKSKYTRPKRVFADVLKVIRNATWKTLVSNVTPDHPSDHDDLQMAVLAKLVQQLPLSRADVASIMEQLPAVLEKTTNISRWALADAITNVLEEYPEDKQSWEKSLLKACIRWLIANFCSCQVQDEKMKETEIAFLSRLQVLLDSVGEVNSDDWSCFLKNGLKYRYAKLGFLKTLAKLIPALYEIEKLAGNLVPLPMIHTMLTNHSLFLPTILKAREDTDEEERGALIDVLLALVTRCPSVCKNNHFVVILGAYGATLHITDQKLLLLLQSYEKNDISLAEFRLPFWGPAAVQHHKTIKSLGKSLWQQPSMEEILSLLDREKMFQTIINFPQHKHLLPEEGKEVLFKDDTIKDPTNLYDPCFLLPLFSVLTTSESVVDCHKFVDVNAFGLTVASLSSYDPKIRAAAYHVLGNYHMHLEAARFKEKRQLLYLLDIVKNGIRKPNVRLTFCLAFYIAKVAQQMFKPEEHMYMRVNRFLLTHQYLNLKKVPGFFKLFYSFDMEHKIEREWILDLLINGLKDKDCFELCDQQKIIHVLLSFFNSPLCDETAEHQIIQILLRAAHITRAAYQLISIHNILTWILFILQRRVLGNRLVSDLISLLYTLWISNLGNKETTQKFLPFPLLNEFLVVLTILIQHIWIKVENQIFSKFLHTLSSVLRHRSGAFLEYKEKGWITLNEKVLSCTEILLLLHKWSIVGREFRMQESLQNLANKYSIKELQKVFKEKNKAKGLGWGATRYGKRKRGEMQEEAETEAEKSCLDECKISLRSIFINWDAELPDETFDPQESQEEKNGVVKETLYIVVPWVIKSALDYPIGESQTLSLLGWLQRNFLPHDAVTRELLKDNILRRHLLQLYTRDTNSVNGDEWIENHWHLFTRIMLQLLEVQGLLDNNMHKSVIAPICLPALKGQDHERKAAALFLLSDYLWDLWLGGQKPHLLLSHVALILEATEDDPRLGKSPKVKQKSTNAIVSLCKDIHNLIEKQQPRVLPQ